MSGTRCYEGHIGATVENGASFEVHKVTAGDGTFSGRLQTNVISSSRQTETYFTFKQRILEPWKDEDLNDEQRSHYWAIPRTHEQWPPPHHMYFGFPCDKPFEYITARAKELGSTRKDLEEIAEQETVDWDNFFMACMDIMHDVIFDKCRFRYPPMIISMRAGSKEGTVGLLTIASNRDEKVVKLPKRALRAIRWAFELPADAQPMWYYSQAYYERM